MMPCLLLVAFFVFFRSIAAFNITAILENYPDFSTFNSFISQAKLASQINGRQTITVLAVANGPAGQLSGMPPEMMKGILSIHVVLDYYDIPKLQKLSKKTAILTTLFQSSGLARGQQGFLNVTIESGGKVAFGSAVAGAPLGADLVRSVDSQPYNISVLEVSSLIIPPEFDGRATNSTTSPPAPNATQSQAPSAASPAAAEFPSSADTPAVDDSPAPTAASPVGDAPPADTPEASAPGSDSPSSSGGILGGGFTLALALALAAELATLFKI